MCQSICSSSTETVQDDRDEIGGKEESIIEAGKVYNSRLNVVVYSLISGTFLAMKIWLYIQGVPKKVSVKPIFKFQTLGGVFFGVKKNSKNFKHKYRLL